MSEPPSKLPSKKSAAGAPNAKPASTPAAKSLAPKRTLFSDGAVTVDSVANEEVEFEHHQRLLTTVFTQTILIAVFVGLLVFLTPFLQPVYHYYARDPDGNIMPLDPLTMPNMTDRALLSWAVTSVTEVMTIGFGDLINQLGAQKPRFTSAGWQSFVAAFHKQRINESFKENQLVLTTVPSDTAVIIAQGRNDQDIYQWKIEVPVIMTYITNNNVTQHHHALVDLTIVRVSPEQNPSGIAIKSWVVQ